MRIRFPAWGALMALLAGLLTVLVAPAPQASAGVIATSDCRGFDPNLANGLCYQFPDGSRTWLGSFKTPDGQIFFCIDKGKSSRLPNDAPIHSTKDLKNQFGADVPHGSVAVYNAIIGRWGRATGDIRSAALGLLPRVFMNDTRGQFPSGLKPGDTIPKPAGDFPDDVLDLAQAMWDWGSKYYGNDNVTLGGDTSPMATGTTRTVSASVISGAGIGVPNTTVTLTYSGGITGPASVVTGADGVAYFDVAATTPGPVTITAAVEGPAANGKLFDPVDSSIQRGWIPKENTDTASIGFATAVTLNVPHVTTLAAAPVVDVAEGPDGRSAPIELWDTVRVRDSSGPQTVTAQLYGPYAVEPTVHDCQPAQLVGEVTFDIPGDGDHTTPHVVFAPRRGWYVWIEHFSGNSSDEPITTPCGIVEETTLVTITPRPKSRIKVRTMRHKEILVQFGRSRDYIWAEGLQPGDVVEVTARLYGYLPPKGTSCDHLGVRAWRRAIKTHQAEVLDEQTLIITSNGKHATAWSKPLERTGCVSWGEWGKGTDRVEPFIHPVGKTPQTALVKSPSKPIIPTGPAGYAVPWF